MKKMLTYILVIFLPFGIFLALVILAILSFCNTPAFLDGISDGYEEMDKKNGITHTKEE